MLSAVAASAFAQSAGAPSAQDVLDKVGATYSHATALHIVAKRKEIWSKNGRSVVISTELEIASGGGRKYFARLKTDRQESIAMSDGEHIWKAVPTRKEWMRAAAGTLATNNQGEPPDPRSQDLYSSLSRTLVGRYVELEKVAQNPRITGEEDVQIDGQKIRCYVIRARANDVEHDLWIDQQRFVVLQDKEKGPESGWQTDIRLKVSALEVNSSLADSLFQFQPGKGWSETDMLFLPGEDRVMLTGSPASNFTLKTLEGKPIVLDQTRGSVVVLDFWASWCPPCLDGLSSLEKLRAEFAGQVQFFGINDEDPSTVKDFVQKHGYEMSVLMDGTGRIHRQYGVSVIPIMLIIDKQGVIRQQFIGSRSEAKLRQAIQAAVASN